MGTDRRRDLQTLPKKEAFRTEETINISRSEIDPSSSKFNGRQRRVYKVDSKLIKVSGVDSKLIKVCGVDSKLINKSMRSRL